MWIHNNKRLNYRRVIQAFIVVCHLEDFVFMGAKNRLGEEEPRQIFTELRKKIMQNKTNKTNDPQYNFSEWVL